MTTRYGRWALGWKWLTCPFKFQDERWIFSTFGRIQCTFVGVCFAITATDRINGCSAATCAATRLECNARYRYAQEDTKIDVFHRILLQSNQMRDEWKDVVAGSNTIEKCRHVGCRDLQGWFILEVSERVLIGQKCWRTMVTLLAVFVFILWSRCFKASLLSATDVALLNS